MKFLKELGNVLLSTIIGAFVVTLIGCLLLVFVVVFVWLGSFLPQLSWGGSVSLFAFFAASWIMGEIARAVWEQYG